MKVEADIQQDAHGYDVYIGRPHRSGSQRERWPIPDAYLDNDDIMQKRLARAGDRRGRREEPSRGRGSVEHQSNRRGRNESSSLTRSLVDRSREQLYLRLREVKLQTSTDADCVVH